MSNSSLDWPARRAPRVVIDTESVVSALVFGGGEPAALRQAWREGRCLPMVCEATERALITSLDNPAFGFSRYERLQLFQEYMRHAYRVKFDATGPSKSNELPSLATVRLALAGRAHALITADPDLLSLSGRLQCPVVSLRTFLDALDRLTPRRSARGPVRRQFGESVGTSAQAS